MSLAAGVADAHYASGAEKENKRKLRKALTEEFTKLLTPQQEAFHPFSRAMSEHLLFVRAPTYLIAFQDGNVPLNTATALGERLPDFFSSFLPGFMKSASSSSFLQGAENETSGGGGLLESCCGPLGLSVDPETAPVAAEGAQIRKQMAENEDEHIRNQI